MSQRMAPIQIHCCASAFPESRPKSLNHSPRDQTGVRGKRARHTALLIHVDTLVHIGETLSININQLNFCGNMWEQMSQGCYHESQPCPSLCACPCCACRTRSLRTRKWRLAVSPYDSKHEQKETLPKADLTYLVSLGMALCLLVITRSSSIKAERTTDKLGMSVLPAQSSVALETKAEKKYGKVFSHLGCVEPSTSRVATEWPHVLRHPQ